MIIDLNNFKSVDIYDVVLVNNFVEAIIVLYPSVNDEYNALVRANKILSEISDYAAKKKEMHKFIDMENNKLIKWEIVTRKEIFNTQLKSALQISDAYVNCAAIKRVSLKEAHKYLLNMMRNYREFPYPMAFIDYYNDSCDKVIKNHFEDECLLLCGGNPIETVNEFDL